MLSIFVDLWNLLLYQPIYNFFIVTYKFSGESFGWTIVGIAILIRVAFLYFTIRGYQHDFALAEIQPTISEIENDKTLSAKEKYNRVSALTKQHGINPFLESLPIFAQAIFLIVLYQILQKGIEPSGFENLYSWNTPPESINTVFYGIDLSQNNFFLSLIGAFALFLERVWEYNEKKNLPGESVAARWDPLILPVFSFILLEVLPCAKAIFLITSVGFSLAIKAIIHLAMPKKL